MLEGAQVVIEQMTKSRDSPWLAGKDRYAPADVFEHWLSRATPYAAVKGCRLFISSSLVHSHVKSIFLPVQRSDARESDDEQRTRHSLFRSSKQWLQAIVFNFIWLFLLMVAREAHVEARAKHQRRSEEVGGY